ncbi:MAG TPA: hypothetical protein VHK88_09905, partial [Aquihabitans sp.]|nr:hypothetical protein [Aquihabitans sp.]
MTTTLRDRSAGHAGSVRSGTGGGRSRPARLRRRARRAARRMLREVPAAIWLLALVSGIGGALAGCAPVGGPLADRLVTAAFAAVVVLLASQATWPPLLLATGIVAAASPNPALRTVGVAGVVACVVLERSRRLEPSGAALLGLLAVQGLLRLGPLGPERASALVTAIAVVPLAISGLRHAPRRLRRPVVALLVAVAVGLVAAVAVTAYATDRARTALAAAEDEVLAGLDAAKAGDREEAAERFRAASIRFGQAQDQTGGWWSWPARQAPAVGHQLRTLDLVASSGRAATDLAYDSAARVDPDRLRMVDGRLDLDAIRSYQPVFDEIAGRTA